MTFRVLHEHSSNKTRCPYRVVMKTTGREVGWINQYLDYETLRRLTDTPCAVMRTSYCTSSVGGRAFITPTWSPKIHSLNRRCSTMSDSNPVYRVRYPVAPLTSALPSSIKPYATCSRMLLSRLLPDSSNPIGNVRPWGLAGPNSP